MTALPRPSLTNVYIVVAIASFFGAVYALLGESPPGVVSVFVQFGSLVAVGVWFRRYLTWSQQRVPFDYGLLFWFGWQVLIPVYAVRSRGARGWVLVGGLFGLVIAPPALVELIQSL
jgi:hypothetical protein